MSRLECPLDINNRVAYVELQVNDNPPAKYRIDYQDSGTVGYASMRGQYAVHGRLTNMSINWANVKDSDIGIIHMIGSINRGNATLTIWLAKPKGKEALPA